jgi:hypothetical protein
MPDETSSRPPARRRRLLRRCFLGLLALILLLVSAVVYVNHIGLPDFVKHSVLARLTERGIAADFSRLRWRWHEGIVAEDLVLRPAGAGDGPEFRSSRATVRLKLEHWFRPRWRVESLSIHAGDFVWVLPAAGDAPPLRLEAIEAEVGVAGDAALELRHFTSQFQNLRLSVSGTLAHPRALSRPPDPTHPPRTLELLNQTMTRVANALTNLQLRAKPELKLRFEADATDWTTLRAELEVELPETRTTWGDAAGLRLLAHVRPPSATNSEPVGTFVFAGKSIETPWGRLEDWRAETHTVPVMQLPLHSSNAVSAVFARLHTRWGAVEDGRIEVSARALDASRPDEIDFALDLSGARWVIPQGDARELKLVSAGTLSRTNWLPVRGTHRLTARQVSATNFSAARVEARLNQTPPPGPVDADESWGFWRLLAPFALDFEVRGEAIAARGVEVAAARLAGSWKAPTLQITGLHGELYEGSADFSGTVDIPTGRIVAAAEAAFDFHGLDHVFTERFRNWFAPYQWRSLPHARVTGSLRWPDWRNFKPNWREDVVPGIGMSGRFQVTDASYKGIPGREAFSDFYFTNYVWHLPNLTIVRPEGRTVARYDGNERTDDYVWQIRSEVDPQALKPLFKDAQLRVFDSFTNHATPAIEGTIWGRWHAHERIGFRAQVRAPRVEVRGQFADLLTATVEYTNRFITVHEVAIQQSNQVGRAEAIGIDLPGQRMYFTNVDSTLPPATVARAIGPVTARSLEPYVFTEPPHVRLNGVLGLKGHEPTDMRFEIDGGPFHWWRFNLETIQGGLRWRSNHLDLTNVLAGFYGGVAAGAGSFQFFTNDRPTEFSFALTTTNAQLQPLVRDVFTGTNRLEGALSGTLEISSGRADSLDTWQGFGDLRLRDGVVWDIPIFGIFSPVFNTISPGLGQSRADEALATFAIVNGTVISRDLRVRSPELSMGYQGSVDFEGNVDAIMQARLLKDSGALGPLISTVLWPLTKIFEYRLSGTLAEPVAEPIHIPKFLFLALEPFKALQGVLRGVGEAVNPKPEELTPTPTPTPLPSAQP